jgi:hypothetical protein
MGISWKISEWLTNINYHIIWLTEIFWTFLDNSYHNEDIIEKILYSNVNEQLVIIGHIHGEIIRICPYISTINRTTTNDITATLVK